MRISFFGAGNMASAIIRSVIDSRRVLPENVTVYDVISEKSAAFASLSVNVASSVEQACLASDVWLLAVKPQDYEKLLLSLKPYAANQSVTVISIAAAISTAYIAHTLDKELPVVRVMPNTPLLLGCGATAISRNAFVDDKLYTKICGLFASSGTVVSLDESLMNAVISVNSSSPAYIYLLAEAMIESAVTQGLDREVAAPLVFQTIKGASEMLLHSGHEPKDLIRMVASPGGTTLAALESFEKNGFTGIVGDAMLACTKRAEEIAR